MSILTRFILTPLIAFAGTALIIFAVSTNPLELLYYFFTSPFANIFNFGNMLNYTGILIISALGISLVFKAGMFNLGGEGQIYAGAFICTAVSVLLADLNPLIALPAAVLAGSLTGAFIGSVSGWLKMKWDTNELISSFLLSSGAIHIINYFITGPLSDPDSYLITTREIPAALRLVQLLPPSKFNISFFAALFCALLLFIYLYRTAGGLRLRISGKNIVFAYYSGIRTGFYILAPFAASGMLNGLAGSFAVSGTYYMCAHNCTAGFGWSAIAVSLIGKNHPLLIIPSAFFIAFMETGMSGITLFTGFPYELSPILQAFVFFFITTRLIKNGGSGDRRYS